jgi:hypothetical protein
MKLIRSARAAHRGSAIIIALTVVTITAIMLGSYLTLVQFQTSSVARSQAWNASIAMSEAGVEEGMALLNKFYPSSDTNKWNWTAGLAADGWSDIVAGGGITSIHRDIYSDAAGTYSYDVTINTNTGIPQITAIGHVPYTSVPWVFGSNQFVELSLPLRPFVAVAGSSASAGGSITRAILVEAKLDLVFSLGLVGRNKIDLNGNNVTVDSFNSLTSGYWVTNAIWGTNRVWNISVRRANGGVGTDSGLSDSLNVGNADIYGSLHTAPGSASDVAQVGPTGSVGDYTYVNGGTSGIQPGAWTSDMNVTFPDVIPPTGSGLTPDKGTYLGTNYNYVLNGGLYTLGSVLSGTVVVTQPNTILWAKAGISFSGNNDGILIAPGASVQIYVGDTTGSAVSMDLTGQGGINANGYAVNCQFWGLKTCTSIDMKGNGAFVGTIYAPYADLTGGGGGVDGKDSSGSIIAKSVTLTGKWNFHFDEALLANGPNRGWIAKNWKEVSSTAK